MTDLEKTSLRSKGEASIIQNIEWQQLADAQVLATPEAQKELTTYVLPPDVHPEVAKSNLSSPPDAGGEVL